MSEEQEMRFALFVFKIFCCLIAALFGLGGAWALSNGVIPSAMAYTILMIIAVGIGSFTGNG